MKNSVKIGFIVVAAVFSVMLIVHSIVNRQDILQAVIKLHGG